MTILKTNLSLNRGSESRHGRLLPRAEKALGSSVELPPVVVCAACVGSLPSESVYSSCDLALNVCNSPIFCTG